MEIFKIICFIMVTLVYFYGTSKIFDKILEKIRK